MYRHYRRTRKPALSPPVLLLVLFIALASVALPSFFTRSSLILPIVLALAFVAIIATTVFIWQVERRRRAKLKALELADIDHMSGVEFEHYIGTLLQSVGYKVSFTAQTGDYGVDLLAKRNHVTYAIQAKRYTGSVGNHAVMEAIAGKTYYRCDKAVVLTSNYFTLHARMQAASSKCILIDRDKLAEWILAFQHGSAHTTFSLE